MNLLSLFCISAIFSSFRPSSLFLSFPPLHSVFPLSVVWSNNLLIIGCKKYLLRDYARYKKLTGDGSQNPFASLMRPGDCKARSAETEHPPPALHWGLTQLSERQLGPAQPGSAQLKLGTVLLYLALVGVINAFTASSSAVGLSVIRAWEFCCVAVCPLRLLPPLICSPPLLTSGKWTTYLSGALSTEYSTFLLSFLVHHRACQELKISANYIQMHLALFQASDYCFTFMRLWFCFIW